MSDIYVVAIDGLAETRPLDALSKEIPRAALRAVNYAAKRGRTRGAAAIREQVNFPARYLSGQDGRLTVKTAKSADDEAVITGRFRPTSLARFVTGGVVGGQNGVTLQVQPGLAQRSRRMFLIRLRAGAADIDTKSNLGLAIRLKPDERIENKTRMASMVGGLYLLYGASVNQVYRSVAAEDVPNVQEDLAREFNRLVEVFL